MDCFELKKVLPIDDNISLEESERILFSDKFCLGILDVNREIIGYVTRNDLSAALKFDIKNYPINLITTLADIIDASDINEAELRKYVHQGLNKGIFIGKNRKDIENLAVITCHNLDSDDRFLYEEFENNISDKVKTALKLCSQAADKISLPIYLIGGVVRDIIIGQKSFDVDITVEENAVEFSRFLKKEYPDICTIKEIHEDFKTTKVIFNIDGDNIELDIASTRKEKYTYPASLPSIIQIGCNIYDDLIRRDFSINSMALSLNEASLCKLVDPLDGYNDINCKKVKILHPVSFIDDPTRIIRALKFKIRFNYEFDDATQRLQDACLDSGLFNGIAGERIKSETKQTFNLNRAECLERFIKEKIYYLIEKNIVLPENIETLSTKCRDIISEYMNFISSSDLIWLIYLGTLLNNESADKIIEIASKLYLSGLETEILLGGKSVLNKIDLIKSAKSRFEIYELLEGYFVESLLIGLINTEDENASNNIDLYIRELQNIKIYTTGKILIDEGLSPGPVFGEILRELLKAKMNQEISTEEDELMRIRAIKASKKLDR